MRATKGADRTLAIGLLGPLRVSRSGRPVELPAGRLRALLAALAMSAGRVVSVDRLATALWDGDPPGDPRANVQTNVKRLRRALGATELIATGREGYELDIDPDQVDALRFVRLLDEAAAASDRATQRDRLVGALALWRGTPFEDAHSEWLTRTQSPRLHERYLAALERRIDLDLIDGYAVDPGTDLAELTELAAQFPLRESLWARLLRVLARSGRPAEALERYESVRIRLAGELGADPSSELRAAHAELLAGGGTPEPAGKPPPTAAEQVAPRQLPAPTAGFTGREGELKALDALVGDVSGADPRPVVISAITGTAGIGKTALAVHWSHRVADQFPDGQLYVNLRGFDPVGRAVDPAQAVRGFLEALGVRPHRVPAGPDAQVGMYRSLLAGKQVLVLLDNARDADQVAPLLPGGPGPVVLVTSRDQLAGLVAAHNAKLLSLEPLPDEQARQLLAHRLSPDRVAAEPGATAEIITRCAGLPLALAIVAARAAAHPDHPLAALAGQLRASRGGLGGFSAGDAATDLPAVFSWSYQALGEWAAWMFRLLGLHPGPDLAADAAASLAGIPVSAARPLLAELVRAHLLVEPSPGRYACHDLLRAYAAELVSVYESDVDRSAATERLLDHYLHTTYASVALLHRQREPLVLAAPRPGVSTTDPPGPDAAEAWLTAERTVLLAAIRHAAGAGFDRHTCQLAWALSVFLHWRGWWHDRLATQLTALDAARRLADRTGQVRSHRNLAWAHADLGSFDDAHRHLRRALDLAREADDPVEQAWTHYYRNVVYGLQGRDTEALDSAECAQRLFQAAGDPVGRAVSLTDVGWYHGRLGNHSQALALCGRALAMHQESDDRAYQAHTWSCLGEIHHRAGDHHQAISCYREALSRFQELGNRHGEASVLVHLGASHHALGESTAARDAWRCAHDVLGGLDQPAADQVHRQLHQLDPRAAEAFLAQPGSGHPGHRSRPACAEAPARA